MYTKRISFSCEFSLLSAVSSLMSFKRAVKPEGLVTLLTFIGLLSRVQSHVSPKARRMNEGFPTVLTFIGFLTGVDSPVDLNIT